MKIVFREITHGNLLTCSPFAIECLPILATVSSHEHFSCFSFSIFSLHESCLQLFKTDTSLSRTRLNAIVFIVFQSNSKNCATVLAAANCSILKNSLHNYCSKPIKIQYLTVTHPHLTVARWLQCSHVSNVLLAHLLEEDRNLV